MESAKENVTQMKSIYFPSEINIDADLFLPLATKASSIDCMVGYFSSGFLSELAVTISTYLNSKNENSLRFIVSPNLEPSDIHEITQALEKGESFFHVLFPDLKLSSDDLRTKSQQALALLIFQKRLDIKIAIKEQGIFHTKCWLFKVDGDDACVHGSSNATKGGLFNNFEQLVLSRSWMSAESHEICNELRNKFESIWSNSESSIQTVVVNEATFNDISNFIEKNIGHVDDNSIEFYLTELINEWEKDALPQKKSSNSLQVPEYVDFSNGDFQHQGHAVNAWEANSHRGILSIATGGGKTYTSLVAATRLQKTESKLLVIIAVPTKTLMSQWEGDVSEFKSRAINTMGKGTQNTKAELKSALRRLRLGVSNTEVFIITHNLLAQGDLNSLLEKTDATVGKMLIADEVHNLGSETSQKGLSESFNYRIGLSATHVRQFDEDGTEFLLAYFGEVVYEFPLQDAIGKCLVPYNYYPHFVFLSAEEQDYFEELTYEINRLSFAQEESKDSGTRKRWESLCRKRRTLVESCEGKVRELHRILRSSNFDVDKALIFCTDKNPKQLLSVNKVLSDAKVKFHQITESETSNPKLLKKTLRFFASGDIKVLTSKRVLDEGFNVPQTELAFLLASNTVYRQWIQRLGRILRKSEETGKSIAHLHDFVVLPLPINQTNSVDSELSSLLKSELRRVTFFSELSSNYSEPNGGGQAVSKILKMMGAL